MKTKLRCLMFLLVFTFLEAGCGGSNGSYSGVENAGVNGISGVSNKGDMNYDYSTSDGLTSGYGNTDWSVEDFETENTSDEQHVVSNEISEEMLVYTCKLEIDTLQFDDSVSQFKTLLSSVGGFIENESYSNGRSYNKWYYDDDYGYMQSMTATVRVPSSKYNSFVEGVSGLGDLRDKQSYVENVKQEYTDINTTLDIYEAKQERYLKLLEDAMDEQYAIQIENELTDIQIKIAQIKTRMMQIETDVAYSYVTVNINEVRQYTEKPVKKDTFLQRLATTIKDSWSTFLEFAENVLFLFIMWFPYLVILVVVILLILKLDKVVKKRREKKKDRKAEENGGKEV